MLITHISEQLDNKFLKPEIDKKKWEKIHNLTWKHLILFNENQYELQHMNMF